MLLCPTTLEELNEAGLSLQQVITVARIIEREVQRSAATARNADSLSALGRPMTNAERSRAFRERARNKRNAAATGGETQAATNGVSSSPLDGSTISESSKEVLKKEEKKEKIESAREADEIHATWERFATWCNANGVCPPGMKVPHISVMSAKRRASARARHKEFGMAKITQALNIARQTPGVLGHNDDGFIAHVDWLLYRDTVPRLLEGKYEHWKPKASAKQRHATSVKTALNDQLQFITGSGAGDLGADGNNGPEDNSVLDLVANGDEGSGKD